jgi:hypothetical protein
MIWAAVAWPLLAGAVSVILFNRRVTPFEALALLLLPLICIWYFQKWGRDIGTSDIEYRTAPIASAVLRKPWTERAACQHIKKTEHGTTKKHDYDDIKHRGRCFVTDSEGRQIDISEERFDELCRHFRNREAEPLPDNLVEDYKWVTQVTHWGGEESNVQVATTAHEYFNPVPASQSVYTYEEVDPSEWRLYRYPEIENSYEAKALLGLDDPEASRRLDLINARFGPQSHVRAMIIVFVDKPREAGLAQEAYWQGGNQNEFVICIGVDYKKDVKWSHVFAWSDKEDLKIEARNLVADQKGDRLDLAPVMDWLENNLQRFEPKSFSDFDYLSVTPPLWYVLTCHLLILLLTGIWFHLAVIKPDRE